MNKLGGSAAPTGRRCKNRRHADFCGDAREREETWRALSSGALWCGLGAFIAYSHGLDIGLGALAGGIVANIRFHFCAIQLRFGDVTEETASSRAKRLASSTITVRTPLLSMRFSNAEKPGRS